MESCVIIRDMALVWQSTGHFKTEEKDCSWDCGLCLQLNRLWYYFLARSPTPTWRNLACIYVKTEYRVFLSFAMNIIERLTLLRLASCLSIHARCHNMFLYLYFILFSKPIWWPLDMNSLLPGWEPLPEFTSFWWGTPGVYLGFVCFYWCARCGECNSKTHQWV